MLGLAKTRCTNGLKAFTNKVIIHSVANEAIDAILNAINEHNFVEAMTQKIEKKRFKKKHHSISGMD